MHRTPRSARGLIGIASFKESIDLSVSALIRESGLSLPYFETGPIIWIGRSGYAIYSALVISMSLT
jgi:hypothetical protein